MCTLPLSRSVEGHKKGGRTEKIDENWFATEPKERNSIDRMILPWDKLLANRQHFLMPLWEGGVPTNKNIFEHPATKQNTRSLHIYWQILCCFAYDAERWSTSWWYLQLCAQFRKNNINTNREFRRSTSNQEPTPRGVHGWADATTPNNIQFLLKWARKMGQKMESASGRILPTCIRSVGHNCASMHTSADLLCWCWYYVRWRRVLIVGYFFFLWAKIYITNKSNNSIFPVSTFLVVSIYCC